MSTKSGKTLLAATRNLIGHLHYSIHTERAYCDWIARFVRFHQQVRETLFVESEKKVEDDLPAQANVAASKQNQAVNALVFFYKQVLNRPLANGSAGRSRKEPRIPEVLTREEAKRVRRVCLSSCYMAVA